MQKAVAMLIGEAVQKMAQSNKDKMETITIEVAGGDREVE
jgi:hypothetical protein